MAMSNTPRRANPKPNTIQSIFNLNKLQGSEELLAHPERWIEAAVRQPQPPPPPQYIRRASPTGASSRSTLPAHLASASLRNRNRNRIRNENGNRDLIRGSPQSRTHVQAHDPIRHVLRDQIPSRTRDRSPSQKQKQAAMAKYAPPIATPPTPTALIDINNATAALTPKIDNAIPSAMSPSPDRRPFIPLPPFRGSIPQPPPPQTKREREEELRTLTIEMGKRSDRGIGSYSKSELRAPAAQMGERADRRDGSGRSPMFVPGLQVKWYNEDSGREVEDTSGVYNTEEGPRRALQALRHALPVGWFSRGRREEEIELVGVQGRQTRAEVEDGRDDIRKDVVKYLGDSWETDERGRCSGRGASGTTFKKEQPSTTSSTSASRKKSNNAVEGGAIEDQCKPPPIHRPSTTNPISAPHEPGPLNIRPAFENWALEVEEDAKRSAEEESPALKQGGNGVGLAERGERVNTNIDTRMRGPGKSGLEIVVEEAAEDAEWVLVPAPAPATNAQNAGGEEVEVEIEIDIEVEAEDEAEWCVVRT